MGARRADLVTVQLALRVSRSALATGVVDAALRRTSRRCRRCGRRVYRVGTSGGEGKPVEPVYLCGGCREVFSIRRKTRRAWPPALYEWLVGTVVPYVFEFEQDDDHAAERGAEGEDFDDR
jgi:hypothetical protein